MLSIGKAKKGSGLRDWLSHNQINYSEQRREAPDALGRFQPLISFCSQTQRKVFEIFIWKMNFPPQRLMSQSQFLQRFKMLREPFWKISSQSL